MARVLRNHWKIMTLQLVLVATILGFIIHESLRSSRASAAMDSEPTGAVGSNLPAATSSLDFKTYKRVQQLRLRLALTMRDLSVAGCTQAQAVGILTGLLNWTTSNAAAWDEQEAAQRAAHESLATAIGTLNVGPSNPAVLASVPSLQQAVAAADSQYDQFFQGAMDSISGQFNSAQLQVIATAKANVALGAPDAYRYATGLTAENIQAINIAINRSGGVVPQSYAGVNLSAPSQGVSNADQYAAGVATAEASILPVVPH